MNIITKLLSSIHDKGQDRNNGSFYSFLFGGSSSGKLVNERFARP